MSFVTTMFSLVMLKRLYERGPRKKTVRPLKYKYHANE
jgi:hypothetical protein